MCTETSKPLPTSSPNVKATGDLNMCNSLDRVAEELAESDLNGKCTKSENCVALDCSLSYLGIPISMNLILLPCEEPFGISVSVHSEILGGVIINGVYKTIQL